MHKSGRTTTWEERLAIAAGVEAGQSSREIAQALGRPLATVRKWRQRYLRAGHAGLVSQMGRPATGALGSVPAELKAALHTLREQHPGWGPQTLRVEIAKDARFASQKLPSRARIAAYLKEQALVRPYERQQELPEPAVSVIQRPHQEWEMDAQGVTTVADLGRVSFINVLDVASHVSVDSHACLHTAHPCMQDYQQVLRRAFIRYGLPEQISLDHDSAFYDNKSQSPFPSGLHLWLLGLGVQVRFIHRPPPFEHARIERHHQTVWRQAVAGQTFTDITALQEALQARILFLNQDYPSAALAGQAPWQAMPQARHSGRPYTLESEAQLLDLHRIYAYLQQGRWFRRVSQRGTFSLGGVVYNVSTRYAQQSVEITFESATQTLKCRPEKSAVTLLLELQGLTKTALMGDGVALPGYTPFQLALPWTPPHTTL